MLRISLLETLTEAKTEVYFDVDTRISVSHTNVNMCASKIPLVVLNVKPRVVLGLLPFGPDKAKGARITSLREFERCLDHFQQKGYNEVDTARIYLGGTQEAFTAQARWKERGLTLATKWYPMFPGAHNSRILRENLELSLNELGTT